MGEVIERVKWDPELDEHQQRQLWYIIELHNPNPLSIDCLPLEGMLDSTLGQVLLSRTVL